MGERTFSTMYWHNLLSVILGDVRMCGQKNSAKDNYCPVFHHAASGVTFVSWHKSPLSSARLADSIMLVDLSSFFCCLNVGEFLFTSMGFVDSLRVFCLDVLN